MKYWFNNVYHYLCIDSMTFIYLFIIHIYIEYSIESLNVLRHDYWLNTVYKLIQKKYVFLLINCDKSCEA